MGRPATSNGNGGWPKGLDTLHQPQQERKRFLVNTGAEDSIVLATGLNTRILSPSTAFLAANGRNTGPMASTPHLAANGSNTAASGPMASISSTNILSTYKWEFVVAEVTRSLLGADFLRAHSLLLYATTKQLVNANTFTSTPLTLFTTYKISPLNWHGSPFSLKLTSSGDIKSQWLRVTSLKEPYTLWVI